ncbi:MAG TPA: SUMF1/EgtB/PvdO family nonheme iron enzyme [Niastella sp.]
MAPRDSNKWNELFYGVLGNLITAAILAFIGYIFSKFSLSIIRPFFLLPWYILLAIAIFSSLLVILVLHIVFKEKSYPGKIIIQKNGSPDEQLKLPGSSQNISFRNIRYWLGPLMTAILISGFALVYSFTTNRNKTFIEPEVRLIKAGTYPVGTKPAEYNSLSGKFNISPNAFSDDLPFSEINISDSFKISRYETTIEEYELFLKDTHHSSPPDFDEQEKGGKKLPVTLVTHADASAYCDWLTEKTGRKYRLPKEEEWEIAAAGDKRKTYPWGNETPDVSRANFAIHKNRPVEVGSYSTNVSPFGVQDMAGNVAEWCLSSCPIGDVVRGGSWADLNAFYLRCANRQCIPHGERRSTIGFRIVRE